MKEIEEIKNEHLKYRYTRVDIALCGEIFYKPSAISLGFSPIIKYH